MLLSRHFLGLETKTETWTKWTRVHSSLETMVSKSHHLWLHQFQLVTEHSLKGATNYGNRATGIRHQAFCLETKTETWVFRSRDQDWDIPWPSGLETWTKWTQSLETMISTRDHGLENLSSHATDLNVYAKSSSSANAFQIWCTKVLFY